VDIKKPGAFTVPVEEVFWHCPELTASELEVEADEKTPVNSALALLITS